MNVLPRKNLPLHSCAINGNVSSCRVLLAKGYDVSEKDSSGYTPLQYACLRGHDDVVRVLLGSGANPNEKNFVGDTLVHLAAMNGHLNVVEVLAEHGAYLNEKNNNGKTPFMVAVYKDRNPMGKWVVAYKKEDDVVEFLRNHRYDEDSFPDVKGAL